MRFMVLKILVFLMWATTGAAATLNESDVAGGFASPSQNFNPTYAQVGSGFDVINGTASANNFDFLQFTSLPTGPQTVSFTLSMITPNANAFSNAGGEIRYSTVQTSGPYTNNISAGTFNLQAQRNIDPSLGSATLSFSLDNTFAGGDLFVNILQTFGNRNLSYSIAVPSNLASNPAPVPLPPAGILLASVLGFGLVWRGTRRSDLHPAGARAT